MEPAEIVNYWNRTLCEGQYRKNGREIKRQADMELPMEQFCFPCKEALEKVTAYTRKERLQEFICLYALYVTMHQIANDTKIGIMVPCGAGYAPLVYAFGKEQSVKEDIQQLYQAYKTLFAVSKETNQVICKHLSEAEKACIQGKGHLYFSYRSPDSNGYTASSGASKTCESPVACESADSGKSFLAGQERFCIEGGQVTISYYKDPQQQEFVKCFLHYYEHVLNEVIEKLQNQGKNSEITLLSEKDSKQLLDWGAGTPRRVPTEKSLYEQFLQWVEKQPEETAVSCGEELLTYRELNERVTEIAHQMQERQVKKGERVVLFCQHSCQTIAAVLAIWAVGAVYVSVAPETAYERICRILSIAKPKLLLMEEENPLYQELPQETLMIGAKKHGTKEAFVPVSGEELHMIFTSGTTGEPKAVMIEAEGFLNLCQWYGREYGFDVHARTLLLTNYSFDASVKNIIVPLITGGQLHLVSTNLYDVEQINRIIAEKKITHINCVPSLLNHMLELEEENQYRSLDSLQVIVLGGEKFMGKRIRAWVETSRRKRLISNVYGPTEATDLVVYHHVSGEELRWDTVPIGKPLDNKYVYILDKELKLCPCYKTGMLYLAGNGVIHQYFGSSGQSDKFVENPYKAGEILYATGDLARWNSRGEVEYIGRSDHQIKINGQRIELEEIEKVALYCKGVEQSAAIVRQERGSHQELVLCYTIRSGAQVEKEELKQIFSAYLSPSLQPNRLIAVKAFPVNHNGKIDRKALLEIVSEDEETGEETVKPKNELEQQILEIWKRILGKKDISVNIPFFEAGGNSLLLNTLKAELEKGMDCKLSLTDFFEYPTIEKQAEQIKWRN